MSDVMHDDASDLAAARAGCTEAFARLYDRHAAVVFSLCRQLASFDPDDALQETFVRAYQRLDQVEDATGFRSWLYAIARFVCSEQRRSIGRRQRHEHHAMVIHADRLNHTPSSTPVDALERSESLDRLSAAIDELPDDERLAVHFYYLEADAVKAAQESLGISRSGFYKLLNRAKQRLAEVLSVRSDEAAELERS